MKGYGSEGGERLRCAEGEGGVYEGGYVFAIRGWERVC